MYQVTFDDEATKLPADAAPNLRAVVDGLKSNNNLRLQLMAYAGGAEMTPNNARRMSLRRALSVRSYLIDQGVRSTRIDVRALGNKTTEQPANRVDVMVVER
ncbi:MAG: OmpA family protein [Hyphomicrobiales bacterium]|nr:OmpA family protein [Hyphomicrobiales bacterium]MCP5371663.1 OmpA family protein [Hyphomicrobiales bacterium]